MIGTDELETITNSMQKVSITGTLKKRKRFRFNFDTTQEDGQKFVESGSSSNEGSSDICDNDGAVAGSDDVTDPNFGISCVPSNSSGDNFSQERISAYTENQTELTVSLRRGGVQRTGISGEIARMVCSATATSLVMYGIRRDFTDSSIPTIPRNAALLVSAVVAILQVLALSGLFSCRIFRRGRSAPSRKSYMLQSRRERMVYQAPSSTYLQMSMIDNSFMRISIFALFAFVRLAILLMSLLLFIVAAEGSPIFGVLYTILRNRFPRALSFVNFDFSGASGIIVALCRMVHWRAVDGVFRAFRERVFRFSGMFDEIRRLDKCIAYDMRKYLVGSC